MKKKIVYIYVILFMIYIIKTWFLKIKSEYDNLYLIIMYSFATIFSLYYYFKTK